MPLGVHESGGHLGANKIQTEDADIRCSLT